MWLCLLTVGLTSIAFSHGSPASDGADEMECCDSMEDSPLPIKSMTLDVFLSLNKHNSSITSEKKEKKRRLLGNVGGKVVSRWYGRGTTDGTSSWTAMCAHRYVLSGGQYRHGECGASISPRRNSVRWRGVERHRNNRWLLPQEGGRRCRGEVHLWDGVAV